MFFRHSHVAINSLASKCHCLHNRLLEVQSMRQNKELAVTGSNQHLKRKEENVKKLLYTLIVVVSFGTTTAITSYSCCGLPICPGSPGCPGGK